MPETSPEADATAALLRRGHSRTHLSNGIFSVVSGCYKLSGNFPKPLISHTVVISLFVIACSQQHYIPQPTAVGISQLLSKGEVLKFSSNNLQRFCAQATKIDREVKSI